MQSTRLITLLAILISNVATAQSTTAQVQSATRPHAPNLLANGGFESWSLGAGAGLNAPPTDWAPMGAPQANFTQTSLIFDRVVADCAAGGRGEFVLDVTSLQVGGYVSQEIEGPLEFCERWVTFSIDLSTSYAIGQPMIEVFDGVTSTSASVVVYPNSFERLSVSHFVSMGATSLEFRIYPEPAVLADNAQAVLGKLSSAIYTPIGNGSKNHAALPLGSVIDWWRFDSTVPVPEGFAICDGSTVDDATSPFVGLQLPDLQDKFVRGVTVPSAIGYTGGANVVDLAHDHSMPHTHQGLTDFATALVGGGGESFTNNQGTLYPHQHSFGTGQPSLSTTQSSLGVVSIMPEYVGLLKLVRIR